MVSPPPTIINEECDDIFGPPRTYPMGYSPPRTRPSMISPKYRQKEERRKVLKISMNKMNKIEDPEASLRRSVLINNTMKRLQQEARDEKLLRQQFNYPITCSDNERTGTTSFNPVNTPVANDFTEDDFSVKLAQELDTVGPQDLEVLHGLVEQNLSGLNTTAFPTNENHLPSLPQTDFEDNNTKKRSFDDLDDCDVQDVLSQFYMPPTPRMLTCIDDDEEVSAIESSPKRAKVENETISDPKMDTFTVCDTKSTTDFSVNSVNNYISNIPPSPEPRLRYLNPSQNVETDSNSFSCGHASMFSELQNNVFHNLIASLET